MAGQATFRVGRDFESPMMDARLTFKSLIPFCTHREMLYDYLETYRSLDSTVVLYKVSCVAGTGRYEIERQRGFDESMTTPPMQY